MFSNKFYEELKNSQQPQLGLEWSEIPDDVTSMYKLYEQEQQQLAKLTSNISSTRTQWDSPLSDDTFQQAADDLTNLLDIISDTSNRTKWFTEGRS